MDLNMPLLYSDADHEEEIKYSPHGVNYQEINENMYQSVPMPTVATTSRPINNYHIRNCKIVYRDPGCPYKDSKFLPKLTSTEYVQEDILDESADVKPSKDEIDSSAVSSEDAYINSDHYKRKEYFTYLSLLLQTSLEQRNRLIKKYADIVKELKEVTNMIRNCENQKRAIPRKLWLNPDQMSEEDMKVMRFSDIDILQYRRKIVKIKKQLDDLDPEVKQAYAKYSKVKNLYDSCTLKNN